jgi:hypothetical protein
MKLGIIFTNLGYPTTGKIKPGAYGMTIFTLMGILPLI